MTLAQLEKDLAPVKKTEVPDLSRIDFDKAADQILKQAIAEWRGSMSKQQQKSAVDERLRRASQPLQGRSSTRLPSSSQ